MTQLFNKNSIYVENTITDLGVFIELALIDTRFRSCPQF